MAVTETEIQQKLDGQTWLNSSLMAWIAAVFLSCGYVFWRFGSEFDGYETGILAGVGLGLVWLIAQWRSYGWFFGFCAVATLAALALYNQDMDMVENRFFLKYFLSSQSAIMWMSALFVMAIFAYAVGFVSPFSAKVGSALCWVAAGAGLVGLLVRWHETYLVAPDIGYIPVANLYEVFVLFAVITALLYLYYEHKLNTRHLGFFVMLIIASAVGFLLWYHFERNGSEIKPLVPALQSYWMKIHVPANFIGYGAFALAAMVSVAYLIADYQGDRGLGKLLDKAMLEELSYRAITLGFAFFTLATILGALWAAEAWGSYWSWDAKETWALIVWLNYAGWLHLRLSSGLRGTVMAWWAIIGLFVTLFAFVGVNIFLSGLHSYGGL